MLILSILYIRDLIESSGSWLVFLIVLILGLSVGFYLYNLDRYSLIYFGDAASHMVGSRKIIDWKDPGLGQLGTTWLPLPHFLLLPFTLIDPLFTTGFAGLAVSLPSLAITSSLLYRMMKANLSNGFSLIAFVLALLYGLNPNILYMGVTAMTEAPFMLFFVSSAYYFQKWQQTPYGLKNLVCCSIFLSLATLCRYEAWVLPIFLISFVTMLALKKKIGKANRVYAVFVSIISISGIILWLSYNEYQYGNPMKFANAEYYSAAFQTINRSIRETPFLQPANVLTVYSITALMIYGPMLLAAASIGYILYSRSHNVIKIEALYIFLALPPIFTILTILLRISEITYWLNSRFLILLSPLIIVSVALLLRGLMTIVKKRCSVPAVIMGVLFVFQLTSPAFGVVTYLDAKGGFLFKVNPYSVQTGEALRSIYNSGDIMMLTGSAQEHRIIVTSGIHLVQFDEIIESSTWKKSFYEPWLFDKWVVISKEPSLDGVKTTKYWAQEKRNELNEHYRSMYENKYYEILVLR
jgi:4-amino-4-deoxy-L-arabinose transferase-like glycosyltransferase